MLAALGGAGALQMLGAGAGLATMSGGALAQAMRWAESEASDKAIAEAEEDPIKRNQRLLREDAERKAREREEIRLRILDDKCA
jgi:hypothetical protein